ncbi:putative nitrate reductase, nirV-like; putative signal peptide [Bradyrhizobium sp. ORS 278]|uniref:SUMF1/EgtB/PvdO family nonheme iron enzyme n=1 Tax=Bradyrhizobium sp. (strain ORS 278) TaxID=114615 RepID=UPI0001507BE9|nr:SUMF1/EgtB/PvdO family nonheme iron enzyme [Bradyrhizobium sp. ORS 278]CAL75132.1 putative nitrate reductase, nirV-like; putative signal peptide [Bradyrhizobium sp. ORS 278]
MLLAFKIKIALACLVGIAGPTAIVPIVGRLQDPVADFAEPALVEIAPGRINYRDSGDYIRDGRQAEAPITALRFDRALTIMIHQVSAADYQACVEANACRMLDRDVPVAMDRPAVQVSWLDASAYADWLSLKTGQRYRLPTDAEWAFAAGSRFKDDGLSVDDADPSRRWIARYERESALPDDPNPRSFGGFGKNEHGVADLAGNVWEWTSTCFTRKVQDGSGRVVKTVNNCGVRLAEGAHRAYVTDFIRDARAGGCASGRPPANLGFRLIREQPAWSRDLPQRLSRLMRTFRA